MKLARVTAPIRALTRLASVDALRGAAVGAMIFFNNTVSTDAVPTVLVHARWNGFTVPDGVFPLFLFVAGTSMSLAAAARPPRSTALLRRCLILIGLGLALNFLFYGLPLRIPGILQRIALAGLLAAPFARARPRTVLLAAAALMAAHTAVLLFVSAPGVTPGAFERGANIAGWIDTLLLGREHLIGAGFDPEGVLGVLTSASEVLLGVLCGGILLERPRTASRDVGLWGLAWLATGLALSFWVPVNKRLFTATFALVAAGANAALLAMAHRIADGGGSNPLRPLIPLGRNAVALYVGASVLQVALARIPIRLGTTYATVGRLTGDALAAVLGRGLGSIAVSALYLLLWWAIASALDRRGVYVKL